MKILAYILSFYVLVLTAIPCIDVPQDNTLQKIELTKDTNNNHQKDTDHCSPFCSCYCCASPIFYQVLTIQIDNFSLVQKHHSEYQSHFISSICTTIWQPPKLS